MKKVRKNVLSMIFVLLLVVLASCSNKDQQISKAPDKNEASNKIEKTKGKIRVGILAIDDVLPLVVANEEGAFSKAGLDVELFPFKSSLDQSKAMEAGQLDLIMNDMIVQSLLKKAGLDTKVLSYAFGANVKEGKFVVVSSPKSEITKPEDLYGKKVAISENTMMDYLMYQYENNLGLDSSKIKKVNIPDLLLRMELVLEGKDIDCAILPDPLASFAIKKGCKPIIDDTLLSENFSQSVILARDEFIDSHRDELKSFMKVYFNSMDEINKNPDKYKDLAIKNARVADDIKDTYKTPTFTPYKVPSKEDVKRVSDWLVEKKLIDKAYSYEDLVSTEFTDKDEWFIIRYQKFKL